MESFYIDIILKQKNGSSASSIMKNIVAFPGWFRFSVKLIYCIGFGSASSAGCLFKSIASILLLLSSKQPVV